MTIAIIILVCMALLAAVFASGVAYQREFYENECRETDCCRTGGTPCERTQ